MDLEELECEDVGWIWQVMIEFIAGSCEHSNEPSGSIKGREFFNQLLASLGLCSIELV
jgi:hypothetical protein